MFLSKQTRLPLFCAMFQPFFLDGLEASIPRTFFKAKTRYLSFSATPANVLYYVSTSLFEEKCTVFGMQKRLFDDVCCRCLLDSWDGMGGVNDVRC